MEREGGPGRGNGIPGRTFPLIGRGALLVLYAVVHCVLNKNKVDISGGQQGVDAGLDEGGGGGRNSRIHQAVLRVGECRLDPGVDPAWPRVFHGPNLICTAMLCTLAGNTEASKVHGCAMEA